MAFPFQGEVNVALLLFIGLLSGIASGLFGIGGGILIVPGLVYLMGFSQSLAVGTSLAVLLPPVGIAAVVEYYRRGHVDLRSALILAASLVVGGWLGALASPRINENHLRLFFGLFVIALGCYMVFESVKHIANAA